MAREHARILCSIWRPDSEFRNRSAAAQRLYFLVLSQRELNNAGVIPLMVAKWARAAPDTSIADVEKALAELVEHRYWIVDDDTAELLVRTFMRNDGILKHPHMRRSGLRSAEQVESPRLRSAIAVELRRSGDPEALAVAARLHPEAVKSGTESTHRDGIPMPSDEVLEQPNSTGTGEPNAMPSSQVRGYGGVGEGGSLAVGDEVKKEGKSESPPALNGSAPKIEPQRDDGPPPDRCQRHRDVADPPACRGCGDARQRAETWRADHARRTAEAGRRCRWCDAEGWRIYPDALHLGPLRPGVKCDHTPLVEHQAAVEASR